MPASRQTRELSDRKIKVSQKKISLSKLEAQLSLRKTGGLVFQVYLFVLKLEWPFKGEELSAVGPASLQIKYFGPTADGHCWEQTDDATVVLKCLWQFW